MVYSEDATEDLCKWDVRRGRRFWKSVLDGDQTLCDVAKLMNSGSPPFVLIIVANQPQGASPGLFSLNRG